ncbi:uncharacterized protein LOC123439731 [Hordeum vulgare subsp. vulgare]|uniref:Uncharacterized protein n=1 Tax=Hordeum vulgare subsp. vulgare TaxID=112509 RepID=A0A8I6XXK5_HORVV|nr:uncharacterized protein LOC123439731 [Hordeum vulgare subsp. vulgare]
MFSGPSLPLINQPVPDQFNLKRLISRHGPRRAAMASSPTTTTACNRGLLIDLGAKLHACASRLRNQFFFFPASTASSVLLSALALLVCGTAFSRVVVFFLPLVVSTTICCAAMYLLVASESSEGGAAKEVVLLWGDRAEVGLLEVYGGANASAYGDRRDVQVGCFLHRSPPSGGGAGWKKLCVDENGEEVVFAGRVVVGSSLQDGAALEEELVSLQVDRFAEGVWDRYFGGSSGWNYVTPESEEMDRSIEQLA